MTQLIDAKLTELATIVEMNGDPRQVAWYDQHVAAGRVGIGLMCSRMANAMELTAAAKEELVLTYLVQKAYCSSVRLEDLPKVLAYIRNQDWILQASVSANRTAA